MKLANIAIVLTNALSIFARVRGKPGLGMGKRFGGLTVNVWHVGQATQ